MTSGNAGALGLGGDSSVYDNQGGGGGGGYYGGGAGGRGFEDPFFDGGGGGGAGGGSSYAVNSATGVSHQQGVRSGNGQIILTW